MNGLGMKMIAWLLCCCMTIPDAAGVGMLQQEEAVAVFQGDMNGKQTEIEEEEQETGEPLEDMEIPETKELSEKEESSESEEPTETVEPTESEEPTETVEPTESEEPSETVEPTESEEPAETVEPTETGDQNTGGNVQAAGDAEKNEAVIIDIQEETGVFNSIVTYSLKNVTEGDYKVECTYWASEGGTPQKRGSMELTAENNYTAAFKFKEYYTLKPNTEYTLLWELKKGETVINTTNSTMKTDPIVLDIKITPEMIGARFVISMQCKSVDTDWSFAVSRLYIRERGAAQWEQDVAIANMGNQRPSVSRYFGKLKSGTEYEIAVGRDLGTEQEFVYAEAAFFTQEETRELEVGQIHTDYTRAGIPYSYKGNRLVGDQTRLDLMYREKGTEEWIRKYAWLEFEKDSDFFALKGLRAGTEYEYAIGFVNGFVTVGVEELIRKEEGTFLTEKQAQTLEITQDVVQTTSTEAVLDFQAQGCKRGENLRVDLTLSTGETCKIYLLESKKWEASHKFSGLAAETDYTITKAAVFLMEEDENLLLFEQEQGYTFRTKAVEAPEQIQLSKSSVTLNYSGTTEYRYVQLEAKTTPEGASGNISWSSDHPEIAYVDSEGKVTAKAAGQAVITASAAEGAVNAECVVTVKAYIIGCETEDGVIHNIGGDRVYKKPGESLEKVRLYEVENVNVYTAVKDFTVSVKPSGIAVWDKEKQSLKVLAEGKAEVYFEKDGTGTKLLLSVGKENAGYFAVTGLTAADHRFPAIKEGNSYVLACGSGTAVTYTAEGSIYRAGFSADAFTWESSDEQIVQADADGTITAKAPGEAVVTVTAKEETGYTCQGEKSQQLFLTVKEAPVTAGEPIYALTNLYKTLKEVPLPETLLEEWQWAEKNTKLYALSVNAEAYNFPVVYTGEDKYPYEGSLPVYIGTIKKAELKEAGADPEHKGVLTVSEGDVSDTLELSCLLTWNGAKLPYEVHFREQEGINIEETKQGTWKITASKAGKYTLKADVTADGEVVTTASYKLTAVADMQAAGIEVDVLSGDVNLKDGSISCSWNPQKANTSFTLAAKVKDRNGKEMENTQLSFTGSNKSAAVVKAVKGNPHQAAVTIKGSGVTAITIKAKDKTGFAVTINLEIRNHQPRVEKKNVTVNTALNYEEAIQNENAFAVSSLGIVPVYGEEITSVKVVEANSDKQAEYEVKNLSDIGWYVKPNDPDQKKGGTYRLKIVTAAGTFYYPLKIKIVNQQPKVTIKQKKLNLFYKDSEEKLEISCDGGNIRNLTWQDNTGQKDKGFVLKEYYTSNGAGGYKVCQSGLAVKNKKVADPKSASGTLTVSVLGWRQPVKVKYNIAYTYRAPALETNNTKITPGAGNTLLFRICDKSRGAGSEYVTYNPEPGRISDNVYQSFECGDKEVSIAPEKDSQWICGTYTGKKSKTITMTLYAEDWREPLLVRHRIEVGKAKAKLSGSTVEFRTDNPAKVILDFMDGNGQEMLPSISHIKIEGTGKKAQELLNTGRLTILQKDRREYSYERGEYLTWQTVEVSLNTLQEAGLTAEAGTYTYRLTPYYKNEKNGKKEAFNTLKLTVKITGEKISAKVKTKGYTDLLTRPSIECTPAFQNAGTGYKVKNAVVKGEYADFFEIMYLEEETGSGSLRIAQPGRVAAGTPYKLTMQYELLLADGKTVRVESSPFTVKFTQSVPKIKIKGNNQTLYLSSPEITAEYSLVISKEYETENVEFDTDCDKDGTEDFEIIFEEKRNDSKAREEIRVYTIALSKQSSLKVPKAGKGYKIPVTMYIKGRDGTAKDAKAILTVKVKQ